MMPQSPGPQNLDTHIVLEHPVHIKISQDGPLDDEAADSWTQNLDTHIVLEHVPPAIRPTAIDYYP